MGEVFAEVLRRRCGIRQLLAAVQQRLPVGLEQGGVLLAAAQRQERQKARVAGSCAAAPAFGGHGGVTWFLGA